MASQFPKVTDTSSAPPRTAQQIYMEGQPQGSSAQGSQPMPPDFSLDHFHTTHPNWTIPIVQTAGKQLEKDYKEVVARIGSKEKKQSKADEDARKGDYYYAAKILDAHQNAITLLSAALGEGGQQRFVKDGFFGKKELVNMAGLYRPADVRSLLSYHTSQRDALSGWVKAQEAELEAGFTTHHEKSQEAPVPSKTQPRGNEVPASWIQQAEPVAPPTDPATKFEKLRDMFDQTLDLAISKKSNAKDSAEHRGLLIDIAKSWAADSRLHFKLELLRDARVAQINQIDDRLLSELKAIAP